MKEDKKSMLTVSPGLVSPSVIFEQATDQTYLVWDRAEEKFQTGSDAWHSFHSGDQEYVPLKRLPWPAVHLPKEYKSPQKVFNEIRKFLVDHLDISNPLLYDVYSCYVLASWRPEDFNVAPYLFFLGPLSSGKTRALECFQRLCYRAIMAASMSAASLFRALEAWHPTLLLDETEIYNQESMVEVRALLNTGYRRGQFAIRMEKVELGVPQIAMFDTFGFKVLAGTEELAATLQSRCILTAMSRAVRRLNLFVDEDRAERIRSMLLMYRFRSLGKDLLDPLTWLKEDEPYRNARVLELFIPLLQVAPSEEIKENLRACMNQITQSRLDAEQASLEARIVEAIFSCESQVENGKVSSHTITEAFNEGLAEREQLNTRQVARRVAGLGFEKCRFSAQKNGFFWDQKLVDRLRARYFPTPSGTPPLTPLTPQTPLMTEENPETSPTTSGVSGVSPPLPVIEESQKTVKSGVSGESGVSGGILEGVAHKTKSLVRLPPGEFQDRCHLCHFQGPMDWQVTMQDETWALLCGKCGDQLAEKIRKA